MGINWNTSSLLCPLAVVMEQSPEQTSQEELSSQESIPTPPKEKVSRKIQSTHAFHTFCTQRWNLRERPPPVQRLDSVYSQELETSNVTRKRKAPGEAKVGCHCKLTRAIDTIYAHIHTLTSMCVYLQAPAPKRKTQKSPPVPRTSNEDDDDSMFAAVLGGRSALKVRTSVRGTSIWCDCVAPAVCCE